MAPILTLLLAALPAPAQAYRLEPGDVVIADSTDPLSQRHGEIRILRRRGGVHTVPTSAPLRFPGDVIVDRDGWLAVTEWGVFFSGVYRIDPATGDLVAANLQSLEEPFQLCRDAAGDFLVADSYHGVVRIDESGQATVFSPAADPGDIAIGILLAPSGSPVVSEAPQAGSSRPGQIFRLDPAGNRTLLVQDPLLPFPNGIALAADGSLLATDLDPYPSPHAHHGLVRVDRSGRAARIAWNSLRAPKDVELLLPGLALVSDVDDESVLAVRPDGSARRVVAEQQDGDPGNGLPVDRPFGLAVVPWLWLTTPLIAAAGSPASITVRTLPEFAGTMLVLAVSTHREAFPLDRIWPGDPQTAAVDPLRSVLYRQRLPATGEARFPIPVPASLAGRTLQLQAFLAGRRLLSNAVSLPVR
ncbi:MAG: hypothetical protein D6702_03065 [Planctomycetota bacterium]|nr:MAG: hypothetical protein D6702_03065 [Planctomycetota bacterium]